MRPIHLWACQIGNRWCAPHFQRGDTPRSEKFRDNSAYGWVEGTTATPVRESNRPSGLLLSQRLRPHHGLVLWGRENAQQL